MKNELRVRGEALAGTAQSEIANYLELVRRLASERLDDIDTKDVRRRADRLSNQVTDTLTDAIVDGIDTVRDRIRPRPKRAFPIALVAVGGVVVGAGVAAYFLSRRQEVRERFTELTGPVQSRLPQVVGRSRGNGHNGHSFTQEESQLRTEVEQAILSAGSPPGDLKVDVEGRTVYLRGHLPDRGYVDAAVERAQKVEGVAAVINLVSA